MDNKQAIHQLYRTNKLLGVAALGVIGLVLAAFVYFQAQSPIYLFVNDTSSDAHLVLLGPTSPAVRVDLAPGEKDYVDMPFWWGEPQLPVPPKYDFIIYQMYELSTFPEDWFR